MAALRLETEFFYHFTVATTLKRKRKRQSADRMRGVLAGIGIGELAKPTEKADQADAKSAGDDCFLENQNVEHVSFCRTYRAEEEPSLKSLVLRFSHQHQGSENV